VRAASIAGMIVGAVCMVSSLLYLSITNICLTCLSAQGRELSADTVDSFRSGPLAAGVAAVGALVLVACTALAALAEMRSRQSAAPKPDKQHSPASIGLSDSPDGPAGGLDL